MEPLDGIEFIKMIRNNDTSPNRYVPIIMLTTHSEPSAIEQARDADVHEFMAKPVSATKLNAKIKRIIEPHILVHSWTPEVIQVLGMELKDHASTLLKSDGKGSWTVQGTWNRP